LPDPGYGEHAQVVIYREEGPARVEELCALRKLDPYLARLSASKALEYIAERGVIDHGFHFKIEAQQLAERVEPLGLEVRLALSDVDSPEPERDSRLFEPFGAPVSVGEPGEDVVIIPFVWILIALIVWCLS